MDEAADVAKSISATNENAVLFVFQSQFHQAVEKMSVFNYQRLVQDKLMKQMDLHLVHISFQEPQHGGDKRRTCAEGILAAATSSQ